MKLSQWLPLKGMIICLTFLVLESQSTAITTMSVLSKSDCFNHDLIHHVHLHDTYEMLYNTDNTSITVCVRAKTTGWVGFGFSPRGAMVGADIFIGFVDGNGKAHGMDCHRDGPDNGKPTVDSDRSDWTVLNGKESNGYTTLLIKRNLDTCDANDQDFLVGPGTTRVIWSYHANDPSIQNVISTYTYHHTNRGVKSLLLLDPPLVENTLEYLKTTDPIAFDVNITMTDYPIPENKTHYGCKMIKLPDNVIQKKHHIIRWEPIIPAHLLKVVHHIVLFKCVSSDNETSVGKQHACYNDRPPGLMVCEKDVFLVWAVGGTPYDFPKDVGQPFGGPNSEAFYKLEIHYDNVKLKAGLLDNSGFRIILTDTPRKIDAGVLQVGVRISINHLLPPRFPSLISRGFCYPGCITEFMDCEPSLTVIGGLLHSHLAGRKIRARLFRNNTELQPILEDEYYDFDYQETRSLPVYRKIYADDMIVVECDYDTEDRTTVTRGGFGTEDEMCLVWLTYFPAKNISACMSEQIWTDVITDKEDYNDVNKFNWTTQSVRDDFVKKHHEAARVTQYCYGVHEKKFNGTVLPQVSSKLLNNYWKAPSQCPSTGTSTG